MTRLINRSTQVLLDLVVLSLALWLALLTRFDWSVPVPMFTRTLFLWPYLVAMQYGILHALGVPRFAWRFIGLREVIRIFSACAVGAAVVLAVRLIAPPLAVRVPQLQYAWLPIGVILIDFALAFLGIVGLRVVRRLFIERVESRSRNYVGAETRILLIGAGKAGVMVAKELSGRPDLGLRPVGFLDDDPVKIGTVVHGLTVLGRTDQVAEMCEAQSATEALITMSNAPGRAVRAIYDGCSEHGIPAKIIPGLYEIVGGHVNLSRIRDIAIEDLLGREPVELEVHQISDAIQNRVVLVTGAGGSIGSEICRQIARFEPSRLVLVEQAENALYQVHRELSALAPKVDIIPIVADICDQERVATVFRQLAPEVVFHAAAHKHVPMMEWNPSEAVKNNVRGTKILADNAHAFQVETFVMISTDKAVNPTSVMGASKRVAELYAQALSRGSKTRFVTVRFGNVLGSAGSVIPLFQEQIARGGPVTVTDPEMRRYFMTIPEACQLVLQAGAMGHGGEIFILDMGEPIKIVDLAKDLIRLSGLTLGDDIEIKFTGMRPGEKLFEELSISDENTAKTRHPKIFVGRGSPEELSTVCAAIDRLLTDVDSCQAEQVRARIVEIVPEYTPEVRTAGVTDRRSTRVTRPVEAAPMLSSPPELDVIA